MDKKNILFLEQYSSLSGGQRVLLGIIKGLDRNAYRISVVVPAPGELPEELSKLNVKHIILPIGYYTITRKNWFDLFSYLLRIPLLTWRLIKIIKQQQIDLVYANAARTFVWSALACLLARRPLIWHIHSIFAKGLEKRVCLFFGKFNIVKAIIAVSEAVKEPLAALGAKITVLCNGVDVGLFKLQREEGKIKQEFLGTQEGLLIATIGLLEQWKNQEDFIQAVQLITKQVPAQTKFLIIGRPLHEQSNKQQYKQRLEQLVQNYALKDKLIFTGYRRDIPQIMQELDILVLSSREPDPCPLVVLEAMAGAVAVIATNFGGPAEIIADGNDGLLYRAGDHQQLAEKMLYLIENEKIRITMAQKAQVKISTSFTQTEYIEKIKNIIARCK